MHRMKKKIALFVAVCMLLIMAYLLPAAAATVYDSTDTTAFLSWKAFNTLLGYDQNGTIPNYTTPSSAVFEFRTGGVPSGTLQYSWTFDGTKFSEPITSAEKGPINLSVAEAAYSDATTTAPALLTLTFDLYNPESASDTTLSGFATLKYNVGSYFQEGTNVSISDGAGYSASPAVTDGFISFDVNKGGTYTLSGTHVLTQCAPASAYSFASAIASGSGGAQDPYIINYTVAETNPQTVSWKSFDGLLGYTFTSQSSSVLSPTQLYLPSAAVFQFTYASDSSAEWSWTFNGSNFTTPITSAVKGPIYLGVAAQSYSEATSSEPAALALTFDLYKPDGGSIGTLPGYASLKYKVGGYADFLDGSSVTVTDDAGYSADSTVTNGYVSFDVNRGGTYTLTAPQVGAEAGSDGTPENGKISGLQAGGFYKITEGGTNVYWVRSDGTLDADKAGLGPLTGTEIEGLDNTKTYLVQRLYPVSLTITGGNGTDRVSIDGTDYTASAGAIYIVSGNTTIKATPGSGREVSVFSDSVDTDKTASNATSGYTTSISGERSVAVTFKASSKTTDTSSSPTERAPFAEFEISSGTGTASNPYISIVDTTFSLSWKAIDMMMGYAMPASNATDLGTKIYLPSVVEFRVVENGRISYSWTFNGDKFVTPITADTKGPTDLNVTTAYDSSNSEMTATFAFMGAHGSNLYDYQTYYPSLKLYVGNYFVNGTRLGIDGPGLNPSTSTVAVSDGYVTFGVNAGGDYILNPISTNRGSSTVNNSTAGITFQNNGNKSVADISEDFVRNQISETLINANTANTPLEIGIQAPASATNVQAVLTLDSIHEINSSGLAGASVKTPIGAIEFDTAALKQIESAAVDSNISVGIQKVDVNSLQAEKRAAVGDSMVINLSVYSNGTAISNFGSGIATVSVPYMLEEGEGASNIAVWYLDDSGRMSRIDGAYYDASACCVVFKTSHFSDYVIGYEKCPFADVNPSDWFYNSILSVSSKDLMKGTSSTEFSPGSNTTRGMLVTILWRMEGSPKPEIHGFSDVEEGTYYYDAVGWAAENGIVVGFDGRFDPSDSITREQLVTIMYRYAVYKNYDLTASADISKFADSADVSAWAADAMEWALSKKLIAGTDETHLDTAAPAQRAQVAAIIDRFEKAYVK